jgi:predicted DNA-binding transcriptional regulator AlpA
MQRIVERERGGKSTMIELDADAILSIREWAMLTGIGYSTARKLLREGNGPKKTLLSMHRIGIAVSSHVEWIRERTKA